MTHENIGAIKHFVLPGLGMILKLEVTIVSKLLLIK